MTENAQNLLALNIVLLGVVAIGLGLMVLWSRLTRGKWPSRKKLIFLSGINLGIWFCANIMYFYFRSH
jgi:small-conductance mechanosensitive channel